MSTVYHSQNLIFGKKMKDLRWTAHVSQVPSIASILGGGGGGGKIILFIFKKKKI